MKEIVNGYTGVAVKKEGGKDRREGITGVVTENATENETTEETRIDQGIETEATMNDEQALQKVLARAMIATTGVDLLPVRDHLSPIQKRRRKRKKTVKRVNQTLISPGCWLQQQILLRNLMGHLP